MFKSVFCKVFAFIFLFTVLPVQANKINPNTNPVDTIKTTKNLASVDNLKGTFNNPIKIIFCDLDDTLIPKDYPKNHVPDSAKLAAKKLKAAKIPMVIATGRTYPQAQEIAHLIGIKNSYFVTMQGSEIIDNKGHVVYKDCIKSSDAQKILKGLETYTRKNAPDAKIYFYVNKTPKSAKVLIIPYHWVTVAVIKSYNCLGFFTPAKIGIYENNPVKLQGIKDYLQKSFPEYDSYLSTTRFCELTTFNANKGNGVTQVSKAMGVDLKNAAAFGDAENDLSMIKLVKSKGGLAVSVQNGMDILKKNANYETKSVTEGGVNYAVDKIIENNNSLKN